jgi:hypothetical protein
LDGLAGDIPGRRKRTGQAVFVEGEEGEEDGWGREEWRGLGCQPCGRGEEVGGG